MKSALVAALVLLSLACGPKQPPTDARDYEPYAIPPGGTPPWDSRRKETATPTPAPTAAAAPVAAAPVAAAVHAAPPSDGAALTVPELKAKVLAFTREGLDQDLIVTYVSRRKLAGKMTVDDILDWKQAGISDEVIKAAAAR